MHIAGSVPPALVSPGAFRRPVRTAAATTTTHDIITTATRGEILDDWGRPYPENKTELVVSVNWQQLQNQADDGYAVEQRLATLLHENVRALVDPITLCTYSVEQETGNRCREPRPPRPAATPACRTSPFW